MIATFAPVACVGRIPPFTVTNRDPRGVEREILAHVLHHAKVGPVDVTVRNNLTSGVVWTGPHVADTGWTIEIARQGRRD